LGANPKTLGDAIRFWAANPKTLGDAIRFWAANPKTLGAAVRAAALVQQCGTTFRGALYDFAVACVEV